MRVLIYLLHHMQRITYDVLLTSNQFSSISRLISRRISEKVVKGSKPVSVSLERRLRSESSPLHLLNTRSSFRATIWRSIKLLSQMRMNSKTPTINTSSSSRIGPQFLFGHVSNILLHVKRNSRRVSYIMKGSQVSKMPWVDLGYWLVLTNFVQQWQFCNYEVS